MLLTCFSDNKQKTKDLPQSVELTEYFSCTTDKILLPATSNHFDENIFKEF